MPSWTIPLIILVAAVGWAWGYFQGRAFARWVIIRNLYVIGADDEKEIAIQLLRHIDGEPEHIVSERLIKEWGP